MHEGGTLGRLEVKALPGGGVCLPSVQRISPFQLQLFPEVRALVSVRASVNTGAWHGAVNVQLTPGEGFCWGKQ